MRVFRQRRLVIARMLSLFAGLAVSWFPARPAQTVHAAEVADLRETLENGLRARLPQDFAFIGLVVQLVEKNQLPRPLVLSTYQWVRKKKSSKSYLVPYFEAALRHRAKKLGIKIP